MNNPPRSFASTTDLSASSTLRTMLTRCSCEFWSVEGTGILRRGRGVSLDPVSGADGRVMLALDQLGRMRRQAHINAEEAHRHSRASVSDTLACLLHSMN
jgi:hypothetical protein